MRISGHEGRRQPDRIAIGSDVGGAVLAQTLQLRSSAAKLRIVAIPERLLLSRADSAATRSRTRS